MEHYYGTGARRLIHSFSERFTETVQLVYVDRFNKVKQLNLIFCLFDCVETSLICVLNCKKLLFQAVKVVEEKTWYLVKGRVGATSDFSIKTK